MALVAHFCKKVLLCRLKVLLYVVIISCGSPGHSPMVSICRPIWIWYFLWLIIHTRLMLLHDSRNDDGIKSFFQEVHELYVKILLNPLYLPGSRITSSHFDTKVRALARKYLWLISELVTLQNELDFKPSTSPFLDALITWRNPNFALNLVSAWLYPVYDFTFNLTPFVGVRDKYQKRKGASLNWSSHQWPGFLVTKSSVIYISCNRQKGLLRVGLPQL